MKWTNSLKDSVSKITQGEIDNPKRRISIKEISLIINTLPKRKQQY